MRKKIWLQHRISCPWVFKNVKGATDIKTAYIRIKAKCPECNAKLCCILPNEITEDSDIIFNCTIKNANFEYIHKKRRQLKGRRRIHVTNTIIDTKIDAISYVRNESKKIIRFGDAYPPILPTTNVLRKAVNEAQSKRLGLTGSKPINNLVDVQNITYIGSIP